MLLRNQVRCGQRVDPWIRQDTVKVTLKKCFLGKCQGYKPDQVEERVRDKEVKTEGDDSFLNVFCYDQKQGNRVVKDFLF